ncbi:hypothetical protein [Coralloluteibacterium stylophorae]|uniref:Holin n=1 Tax=Coralloluteibacterium stylophorae TaxID=1776034 RepID=A0A8J7VT25_9GAMM|nr:hypothetical protein [Coralloluteibacterium stylophorae]MBS7457701.1 hypothetical protein [Coralloluteibacterium stylophorae]
MTTKTQLIVCLLAAGAGIGVGRYLASDEPFNARKALGHALLSGGLGVCAAASPLMFPGISTEAQVGLACVLSSLGASALKAVFNKFVGVKA